jgi:hypothetical protein
MADTPSDFPDSGENKSVLELEQIGMMLAVAKEHNLEAEVVWSFSHAIRSGDDIPSAMWYALCEWDL